MREYFHVPDHYFMSHSVGCLPKTTEAALTTDFLGPWKAGTNWANWMPVLDTFRSGMAQIMDVTADEICPQTNVSSALTKILHSLPPSKNRNQILLSREDFPTIGFVVERAERLGFEMRFIDGPVTDAKNWADGMSSKTAFVHITHALSNTSHLLPVQEICELARAVGAVSIVDVAQSTGIVPVTPKIWGADFVIGTGVKFLCFGPGACFLYASKERLPECAPIDVGWFSHENPFEMEIENFRFATDAMRFFGGTPSPAPFVAANSAMVIWRRIGLATAMTRVQAHIDSLCQNIPDDVLVSPRASNLRGATLVINPRDRTALRENMAEAKISSDERREGFRFSVHGYTSEAECRRLNEVILQSL